MGYLAHRVILNDKIYRNYIVKYSSEGFVSDTYPFTKEEAGVIQTDGVVLLISPLSQISEVEFNIYLKGLSPDKIVEHPIYKQNQAKESVGAKVIIIY